MMKETVLSVEKELLPMDSLTIGIQVTIPEFMNWN